MLFRGSARFLTLAFVSALLLHGGVGKSVEDGLGKSKTTEDAQEVMFDLTDSLYEGIERFKRDSGKTKENPVLDFDLSDALLPKTTINPPPKRTDHWERFSTTFRPRVTKAPPKKSDSQFPAFDLADALDDRNDGANGGAGRPNPKPGGGISDKDLEDIIHGGYKPDKGKGDSRYEDSDDNGAGVITETGTIAGIASGLAMALIGAVTSYISYQQKKFCFNIQQGLNADYVKGEHLEGVSTEEPQVKYSALQTHSAEKPPPETPKI